MANNELLFPDVLTECAEHCPNIKWAFKEAVDKNLDPAIVVSAVCRIINAADCPNPGYSFDEAGDGHRCQAPDRTGLHMDAVAVMIRGAQEILAAGPDVVAEVFRSNQIGRS